MSILLAITTFNEIEVTEKCIISALNSNCKIDIVIIDDYSHRDNIKSLTNKYPVHYIGKIAHTGLTHSWNLAYKYFKDNDYQYLFISNNDVLIPSQSIKILVDNLGKNDCYVVCPSSTKLGAGIGKCGINQGLDKLEYHSNIDVNIGNNYQLVQDTLLDKRYEQFNKLDIFNGFFFGIDKRILEFEFNANNLFNPKLINICNEIDLHQRIYKKYKNKILYVKHAFIYHYKSLTIDIRKRDNLNQLENKYT